MQADFTIHSGWGDHVTWWDPAAFTRGMNQEFRVHGHLPRRPRVGDTLIGEFEHSFIKFRFVKVELMRDPSDQFFATVVPIEQEMKPS